MCRPAVTCRQADDSQDGPEGSKSAKTHGSVLHAMCRGELLAGNAGARSACLMALLVLHAESSLALYLRFCCVQYTGPNVRHGGQSMLYAMTARNIRSSCAGFGSNSRSPRQNRREAHPCSRFLPCVFADLGLPPQYRRPSSFSGVMRSP